MAKNALIVVDVQKDFCEGGALSAADTLSLLEPLAKQIQEARRKGALIVYTRDWHPKNHSSFRAQGGPWPIHCVADSPGAQLMPPLQAQKEDVLVNKGVSVEGAGYSGFEDTGLAERLRAEGVQKVGVTGIATEYCVRATALDSIKARFDTTVLSDLIRAVSPAETAKIMTELKEAGVRVSSSEEWLATFG
jgi:nicotinamidase/pyrazinamidase